MSNLQAETDLMINRGYKFVIGSDEAGRGALAGPVVAASCCILTDDIQSFEPIAGVDDSKALTVEDRRRIYDHVMSQPDTYAINVAEVSNEAVDEMNILVATMDCFRQSIEGLVNERGFDPTESYGIVDGKKVPNSSTVLVCLADHGSRRIRRFIRSQLQASWPRPCEMI